jgi:hypothetical protein
MRGPYGVLVIASEARRSNGSRKPAPPDGFASLAMTAESSVVIASGARRSSGAGSHEPSDGFATLAMTERGNEAIDREIF